MLVLHYAPDNASLIVRLALEEAGAPYRAALVDREVRAQDSAAYRRLNPVGLIPALETSQGVVFETGAILLWLADRFGGGLGVAPDAEARGDFLKWLFFLSNTAHADLRQLFYPENYVPEGAEAGHHDIIVARMLRHFGLLDVAVAADPALFAAPSVLSAYLAVLMRWAVLYPEGQRRWFRVTDFPALAALARDLEARPAALRAALAEGLGRTPFSEPDPACPSEGSAL
ncbi:glutathione S-transferase family protein [Rhodobacter ferrooxidans]|uniref:Glutathione S-transferase domain protein n=1 Tax=Rhodobacter ferrooxidans TaxID=371731 RepID=C8S077_9RHOB|nr:glutathione S-transferase family protein [Rhodobacter sp. SW2]EEW25686.1 Glutathione S-transferase domain protein [Rhodobacter sp. SW2]